MVNFIRIVFYTFFSGFYLELLGRFSDNEAEDIWEAFNDLFAYFPLAAIVKGRILCMHGGISEALQSLDDIRQVIFGSLIFENKLF